MHRGSTAQAGDSLIRAREVAQKARDLLRQDIDPLVAREQQREAERPAAEDGESQPGVALELTGRRYHGTTVAGCAGTGQAADPAAPAAADPREADCGASCQSQGGISPLPLIEIGAVGADSLDTFELVMAFEEEFGCEIPDDAAEHILTVGDAVKFLEKNASAA